MRGRATLDEAVSLREDFTNQSAFATRDANRETLRSEQPERASVLLAYRPRSRSPHLRAAIAQVSDLVLRVNFTSFESDRKMMSVGCQYALYCIERHGEFVPARHLAVPDITRWSATVSPDKRTVANYKSKLSILRTGRRAETRLPRKPASEPYSDKAWRQFERIAKSGESPEATAMIVLAGMLGLRPHEVADACGTWIQLDSDRTWITIPNRHGEIRLVPAFGFAERWLREAHSRGPEHLVRPRLRKRNSVPSTVKHAVARQIPAFAGFSIDRARHTYLSHLLQSPVPLTVVYAVAGLTPGSTLPSDLMNYFPKPGDNAIYRGLARTVGRSRASPLASDDSSLTDDAQPQDPTDPELDQP